jgi:hypothetical protein
MKATNYLGSKHYFPHSCHVSYVVFRRVFPDTARATSLPLTKTRRPETTKPLTSFEIRGSGYIEFGGEGEIRILRHSRSVTAVNRGFHKD